MVLCWVIICGLVLVIFFVSLAAYRLGKNNKEARRIMDRFYRFVAIAAIGVENGYISREQEQTLILDIKESIVGGSVLERLRALDAAMDRFPVEKA